MDIDLDKMSTQDIRDLRYNPYAAAFMGAKYNMEAEKIVGTNNQADLYMSYVFGPGGAHKILEAPDTAKAADILPKAAAANESLFYRNGHALNVGEVKGLFEQKIAKAANYVATIQKDATQQLAENTPPSDSPTTPPPAASAPAVQV